MGVSRWLRKLTASSNDLAVLDAIDGAPPSTIEDLPEDVRARVIGRVEALDDERIVAPLSRREVLAWGYRIASVDVSCHETSQLRPFALVDGKSRAIVEPEHAKFMIAATVFRKSRGVAGADPQLRMLLRRAGATDPRSSFLRQPGQRSGPSTYRAAEWVLVPGMLLAVVGRGIREADPRVPVGYRGTGTLVRISGTPDEPVAITDELV